ncbi:MAG: hypothetical protein ABI429_04440 [Jatrophihabitantaceae bacterium]
MADQTSSGVPDRTAAVFWPFNAVMLWLAAQDVDLRMPGSTSAESLVYFLWIGVDLTLLLRWSLRR